MQGAQHLLDQVFAALKLSLAFAIQHGFIAVLVFCGAIIVATFFLEDIPMTQQPGEAPAEAAAPAGSGGELSGFSDWCDVPAGRVLHAACRVRPRGVWFLGWAR